MSIGGITVLCIINIESENKLREMFDHMKNQALYECCEKAYRTMCLMMKIFSYDAFCGKHS